MILSFHCTEGMKECKGGHMDIEEKVFQRKRFIMEKCLSFGFKKEKKGLSYEGEFMDGDFSFRLTVTPKEIHGEVWDQMNGEIYSALYRKEGSYAESVRNAYEEELEKISEHCCSDLFFASPQSNRLVSYVKEKYGILPDFPWEKNRFKTYGTFRHPENRKWFGLIIDVEEKLVTKRDEEEIVDVLNLKVNPEKREEILGIPGIYEGYHLNHTHWISIIMDDTVPDDILYSLTDESYKLTKEK